MKTPITIIFCESPLEANQVDEDFAEEFQAARDNGFDARLINFEDLVSEDNAQIATRKIKPALEMKAAIYRGWMLRPSVYARLHAALLTKNYALINSPAEYQNCHHLPDSLRFIGPMTPQTIFAQLDEGKHLDDIIAQAEIFGHRAVIVKDYVKSEKHDWDTACFVPDASDKIKLRQTLENFLQLRGDYLNEGIVIREFLALKPLVLHSKSGMPLTDEYRLFFCKGRLLGVFDYWEEGEYAAERPNTAAFEALAKTVESPFFSMDIARKMDGEFVIIELGDGQVSGLPDRLDKGEFYRLLNEVV